MLSYGAHSLDRENQELYQHLQHLQQHADQLETQLAEKDKDLNKLKLGETVPGWVINQIHSRLDTVELEKAE